MTDGRTDGRTDGGDCNIPNTFLKKRGDNQQQQNHHLRTDSSLSHRLCVCMPWWVGGLNAFYRLQSICALDSGMLLFKIRTTETRKK